MNLMNRRMLLLLVPLLPLGLASCVTVPYDAYPDDGTYGMAEYYGSPSYPPYYYNGPYYGTYTDPFYPSYLWPGVTGFGFYGGGRGHGHFHGGHGAPGGSNVAPSGGTPDTGHLNSWHGRMMGRGGMGGAGGGASASGASGGVGGGLRGR